MASVSVKDTALTLPTQSPGEGLPPWPLPAHRLPQRPQPTNLSSSCRRTKLEKHHTFSAQSSRAQRRAGSGPESQGPLPTVRAARVPFPPVPLRARRRRRALRIPHAPEPFAGSHKGPVSWRRSAGNQPGPWPAAPLPIQLAPASPQLPLQPLGRAWEGGAGPLVPPFLLPRESGGGSGAAGRKKAPGPAAADKHLSPFPHYGGHVLHILGRLGAGGGVSSGDWWGTEGEPHPVYPLSSSAPKWGLWGRRQCPRGPAGGEGFLQPSYCLFPPLAEEEDWSRELLLGGWRNPVTRGPPQIPSGPSKAVVVTS